MEELERAKSVWKSFKTPIRILCSHDPDGLAAASMLIAFLRKKETNFVFSSVQFLTEALINEIKEDSVVLLDLGALRADAIKEKWKKKTVLIIDDMPIPEDFFETNIIYLTESSSSLAVYRFISSMGMKGMLSNAIIGSLQSNQAIETLLKDAKGVVQEENGFPCSRIASRPLHKLLSSSQELAIPSVNNDEEALEFLHANSIPSKQGSLWRKYIDLSEEEKELLIKAIAKEIQKPVKEITIKRFTIMNESNKLLQDAHEFASVLYSCARMERSSVAVGALLGDETSKEKAIETERAFRGEIAKALQWIDQQKESEAVTSTDTLITIHGQDHILHSVLGTVAAVLAVREKKMVFATALDPNHNLKVSLRTSSESQDMRKVLQTMLQPFSISCGGTKNAAGALIPSSKEKAFHTKANLVLQQYSQEESIA